MNRNSYWMIFTMFFLATQVFAGSAKEEIKIKYFIPVIKNIYNITENELENAIPVKKVFDIERDYKNYITDALKKGSYVLQEKDGFFSVLRGKSSIVSKIYNVKSFFNGSSSAYFLASESNNPLFNYDKIEQGDLITNYATLSLFEISNNTVRIIDIPKPLYVSEIFIFPGCDYIFIKASMIELDNQNKISQRLSKESYFCYDIMTNQLYSVLVFQTVDSEDILYSNILSLTNNKSVFILFKSTNGVGVSSTLLELSIDKTNFIVPNIKVMEIIKQE